MLSSIFVSCCSITTVEAVDDDPDQVVKVITFQPGKIGIQADWTTGLVEKVEKGLQAERLGVKVDWQFQSIDNDAFNEDLLRAKAGDAKPYIVAFLKKQPGRAQLHTNMSLNAHNVWTFEIKPDVIDEAARIFREEVMPEYLSAKQSGFRTNPCLSLKYSPLQTVSGSRFLAVHSTNFVSDIAWINVDDEETHRRFESLFQQSGVAERCMPFVDHDQGLRLINCQLIVRSVAHGAHMHVDFDNEVGTDALTLMTPITPTPEGQRGFDLLYRSLDGELRTYAYRRGEALVFGAGFEHSTEPGESAEPRAFLCFTFGTDREELWPSIAKTVGRQSRLVRRPCGQFSLTHLGRLIEAAETAVAAS
mmetsp:Transcript_62013/g.181224  ORF Transcript_62013/g.181224 Transcript_62013/m.181224 type:complete len:362 (-) Transcript_62013:14-1099(-)